VRASSLNYHDIFTRRGMPGIKLPMPIIMGLDVAGEVLEIGPGIEGWRVGDRVLVDPANRVAGGLMGETVHGGLAELCRVPVHQLIRLPDHVGFTEAAAIPVVYGTAIRMMHTIGAVQAGEKVLVIGASGGVGVCCVQLAKLAGATVIGCVSSDEKASKLQALGADHTINYVKNDFVKELFALYGKPRRRGAGATNGIDVAVNYTGGDTWVKTLRCLRVGGRLLTCGATAGFNPPEALRYIWTFELLIRGSNGYRREEILEGLRLVASGQLRPQIDSVWTLPQAAEGFRRLEGREVFGKVVITP
ncbi:MAG: zinc-binding dehydrogenase, partial [Hyphomicrobiales bacterium]|nr:zinc-binding dehydrogenase [Hyphomicrobiales bacterium]